MSAVGQPSLRLEDSHELHARVLHLCLKTRNVGQTVTRIRTMVFNVRARTVQTTDCDHLVGLETVSSTTAQLSAYRE